MVFIHRLIDCCFYTTAEGRRLFRRWYGHGQALEINRQEQEAALRSALLAYHQCLFFMALPIAIIFSWMAAGVILLVVSIALNSRISELTQDLHAISPAPAPHYAPPVWLLLAGSSALISALALLHG